MTIEQFEILAGHRFNYCLNLMVGTKHEEYSRQDDKLYNFKRAGEIQSCTPEKALIGMYCKHLVSVLDMVKDLDDLKYPRIKLMMEKISDSINYLVLLEGLLTERITDETMPSS